MRNEKLKIVMVSPTNVIVGAGLEHFILNTLSNIPKEKYDITLIQLENAGMKMIKSSYVNESLKGIKIVQIGGVLKNFGFVNKSRLLTIIHGSITKPIAYFLKGLFLEKEAKDAIKNADIVYVLENQLTPMIRPKKEALFIGSTHVIKLSKTNSYVKDALLKLYHLFLYRRLDGIHYLSKVLKENTTIHKKYDFVSPYGIDTKLFFPDYKVRGGKIRFLIVCRLEASKGILLLLKAWELLGKGSRELHIVGRGSLEEVVKQTSLRYKNIIYHGPKSGADLAKLYRNCDIFIFPSKWETFGLVILEAFSSGLFVIGSEFLRGGFSDDFLKFGAISYPKRASEAIITEIENREKDLKFIRSPIHKRRVFDFVKNNYDAKIVSKNLFEIFEKKYAEKRRSIYKNKLK